MHSRDVAGLAVFLGAVAGFVVGALVGFGDANLSSPFVLPFVGALCGVVATGLPVVFVAARRRRADDAVREARHRDFRVAAHDGWIDGIDLTELRRHR